MASGSFGASPGIYTIPCKDSHGFYTGETGGSYEKKESRKKQCNEQRTPVNEMRVSFICDGHQFHCKDIK